VRSQEGADRPLGLPGLAAVLLDGRRQGDPARGRELQARAPRRVAVQARVRRQLLHRGPGLPGAGGHAPVQPLAPRIARAVGARLVADDGLSLHAPGGGGGSEDPPQPPAGQEADAGGAGTLLGLQRRRSARRRTTTRSTGGCAGPGCRRTRPSRPSSRPRRSPSPVRPRFPKLPMIRFPVPTGFPDARRTGATCSMRGGASAGFDRSPARGETARGKKRLRYEMELIEGKDFIDYFLLVRPASCTSRMRASRSGPARGSAARLARGLLSPHHRGRSAAARVRRAAPLRALHQQSTARPARH
jgi:hypothetical protein